MQLGNLPIIEPTDIRQDVHPIGEITQADLQWKEDIEERLRKVEQMNNILMFALLITAILMFTKK